MTYLHYAKASFLLLLLALFVLLFQVPTQSLAMWQKQSSPQLSHQQDMRAITSIYLPIILNERFPNPIVSPFGVETHRSLLNGSTILERATELGIGWVRLGDRISWADLQPEQNGAIQWDLLEDFEAELLALHGSGITPVVVVKYSPRWATEYPTSCAALRTDALDDFANFMVALVERYKTSRFNVHHWELGNEPDVAYDIVPTDNLYGCWGDRADSYYGGEQYGEMLKVVAPAMRAADSNVKIWFGGLLLDTPETTDPNAGHPERFLLGALTAGAGDSFDILAYHGYGRYQNETLDHDNASNSAWDPYGGIVKGKAAYLRDVMKGFNLDKPLFLNETSLGCPETLTACQAPDEAFKEEQANHLVRSMVRGLSENIMGFIWYHLEGPGWRHVGLLDEAGNPKPAYSTYQQINQQLNTAQYISTANYGSEIEGYIFRRGSEDVHIVWVKSSGQNMTISIPTGEFIAAYSRDGNELNATEVGAEKQLSIGFEPVYVIRTAATR